MSVEIYGPIWNMGEANADAVCAAIGGAGDELDIKIDSPGGDILEQQRMSVALAAWVLEHPDRVATITIEGMAASAAANFVALAPATVAVRCYASSVIMYHSASGCIFGGPGQMRDSARFLEAYNRQVIAALTAKTGMSEADIAPWFADAREEWMMGSRAARIGLATLLDGAPGGTAYDTGFSGNAQLVAFVGSIIKRKGMVMADECKKKPLAADDDIREDEKERDRLEREIHDRTEETERVDDELKNETDERERVEEEIDDKKDEIERVTRENDELKKRLDELETKIARLEKAAAEAPSHSHAVLRVKGDSSHTVGDFAALVRAIPMGLTAAQYAAKVESLKSTYPSEYKAFVEKNSKRLV